MFSASRKALSVFAMDSRTPAFLLLAAITAVAMLEMLSIGLIVPVIQASVFGTGDSRISSAYVSVFSALGLQTTPTSAAAVFGAMFIFKNTAILALSYAIAHTINVRAATAKRKLFDGYLQDSLEHHANLNSAEILRNVMSGCGQAFEAARLTFVLMLEACLSIAALGLLLLIEPSFTLAISGVLILGSFVFYRATAHHFRYWGQKALELEALEIRWINQALGDIRFVKVVGAIGRIARKLYSYSHDRAIYESQSTTAILVPRLYLETLAVLGFLFVAGYALALGKPMADLASTIGVFVLVALRLLPSMNRVLSGLSEIKKRSPFVELIHRDLSAIGGESAPEETDRPAGNGPRFSTIELRGVSHTYGGTSGPALAGVDLAIRRGESIGIVGASGAGKTTLVDIVMGLVTPTGGSVLIDGKPVSAEDRLRSGLFGYVPQEVHLMDDTLRNNFAYAAGGEPIDDERIARVAWLAGLTSLIADLPYGLETVVGERGARLSGGQRQRIAIARALYRDPEILVFDEATASLDNESEHLISQSVASLARGKTIITIAHRLSTIRNCDRIIFMRSGRILEIGTFAALYEKSEAFRNLVDLGDLGIGQNNGPDA